jgi:anaerobic magnesium-protoporphyrin IX monomethyl ester cyclase
MRVALLHFRENYTLAPPMGILYIGTVLRNSGHDIKVLDSFPAHHEGTCDSVRDFRPDIIGLSVLTTGYQIASHYTRLLRKQNPGSLICWGGVHPSALPREVLQEEQDVDFVVAGEGEQTMLEVCGNIEQKKGLAGIKGVVFRQKDVLQDNGRRAFIEDLDALPIPDRELLEKPRFSWYLSPPGSYAENFTRGSPPCTPLAAALTPAYFAPVIRSTERN